MRSERGLVMVTFLKDRGPVNLDHGSIIFILLIVAHVELYVPLRSCIN